MKRSKKADKALSLLGSPESRLSAIQLPRFAKQLGADAHDRAIQEMCPARVLPLLLEVCIRPFIDLSHP